MFSDMALTLQPGRSVMMVGDQKTHIKDHISCLINHRSFADRECTISRVIKNCADKNVQALNSPVQQLPLELLQIIFDYVCECNLLHCPKLGVPTGPLTKLKAPTTKLSVPLSLIPALSIGSLVLNGIQ